MTYTKKCNANAKTMPFFLDFCKKNLFNANLINFLDFSDYSSLDRASDHSIQVEYVRAHYSQACRPGRACSHEI